MNRLLIPLALVVLVAGCAMPNLFGQQAGQPAEDDSARTVVVREIYHETPVYYVDTVFMAEEPAPVQPVYVTEQYNEYNEYNETYVSVHERVVVLPPPPHPHERGWRPREHERRPRDRSGDGSRERRGKPSDPNKPEDPEPQPPPKKMKYAPVTVDRQKSPDKPTPPVQPIPPKRQSPARGGSAPVVPVQVESPKQAPTPPSDGLAGPESDAVQMPVRIAQSGIGSLSARTTR